MQKLGREECPYMERWIIEFKLFSLRLHHWLYSDDQRNYHDHPWWFITLVLKGSYIDISPKNQDLITEERVEELMSVGKIRYRPSKWKHTVKVSEGGCWTLLLTGPEVRDWGFWVKRKDGTNVYRLRRRNKYFLENGHHPCEKGKMK